MPSRKAARAVDAVRRPRLAKVLCWMVRSRLPRKSTARPMGMMTFLLPDQLGPATAQELPCAYFVSGPDQTPWPTRVHVGNGFLLAARDTDESGAFCVPWEVDGFGRLMLCTTTLMERAVPYHLGVELARARVNVLRTQHSEWYSGGLRPTPELDEAMRRISADFARMISCQDSTKDVQPLAEQTLARAIQTGGELVHLYVDQLIQARLERNRRLATVLAAGVAGKVPDDRETSLLRQSLGSVRVHFRWSEREPEEGRYDWTETDTLVRWAQENTLAVSGGPLIDATSPMLPAWLERYESHPEEIAQRMLRFCAASVERYRGEIRQWLLVAGVNAAKVLGLQEEQVLQLTAMLLENLRRIDPALELIVGVAQPWGEYLAYQHRTYSALNFVDTLLRSGLRISGVDLELGVGFSPRGSQVRDVLDVSRTLDLHAVMLGLPMSVTLACPAASGPDPYAAPNHSVENVTGPDQWTESAQADWIERYAALAIAKPYVVGVTWNHWSDRQPHLLPHCGLTDLSGRPRPALAAIQRIRERWLK